MKWLGIALGAFGGFGVVMATGELVSGTGTVNPLGFGVLAFLFVGGVLMARVANARPPSGTTLEHVVLRLAEARRGRLSAVLVASETGVTVAAAERELARLSESGACLRQVDDDGIVRFVFPELVDERAKQAMFFDDVDQKRARAAEKVAP